MSPSLPPSLWLVWWTALGLFVGSFLNVAIHRFAIEGESVAHPRRSRCPQCRTELRWSENVPVLSWLRQRGRCRTCGWRIPWRYPFVELLAAGLWLAAALATPPGAFGLVLVRGVVLSGLVVATFVDLDHLEIPDGISKGGMALAPVLSLAVPTLHADSWLARLVSESTGSIDRAGALLACLGGMAVGGGVLWAIGWIGSRVYGREAMGFGDVKLLAAAGGFIGPGGALAALMVASLVASVAGVGNITRYFALLRARARQRGRHASPGHSLRVARVAGRYLPFGPYLALGIGIALLYWNHVAALVP